MITGNTSDSLTIQFQELINKSNICPNCGYCPTCGKPSQYQPDWTYRPYYSPWYTTTIC